MPTLLEDMLTVRILWVAWSATRTIATTIGVPSAMYILTLLSSRDSTSALLPVLTIRRSSSAYSPCQYQTATWQILRMPSRLSRNTG